MTAQNIILNRSIVLLEDWVSKRRVLPISIASVWVPALVLALIPVIVNAAISEEKIIGSENACWYNLEGTFEKLGLSPNLLM